MIENLLADMVREYGLLAIGVLMAMESALIPVPSELVVPLAGFLARLGFFSLTEVVLVSSFANLIGSLLAYRFGREIMPLLPGKFFKEHAETAGEFFRKHGEKAVFFGRLLPAVRTFVSLPAGIARFPLIRFALLTFLGSLPWNFALAYAGYLLGEKWKMIHLYLKPLTLITLLSVIIIYAAYQKKFKH